MYKRQVEGLLSQGHDWCVELDYKGYFDTIPHEGLLGLIGQRVVDGSVLTLLRQSLKAGVLEEMKGWEPTEAGTPQGAVISPLLANLYLNPLDHEMVKRGWEMVRYADDLVVLCRTREEAEQAMGYLRDWSGKAGLTVHPTKTRIVQVQSEGFDFLGWHFRGNKKWPRKKSLQKLQEKLRPLTRRTRGWSLEAIVAKAVPVGWAVANFIPPPLEPGQPRAPCCLPGMAIQPPVFRTERSWSPGVQVCLLYTSDAADE